MSCLGSELPGIDLLAVPGAGEVGGRAVREYGPSSLGS